MAQVEAPNQQLSPRPSKDTGAVRRKLRFNYFTLEALNGLAAAYYFNYLFFYMRDHFGFDNRNNLTLVALHGFTYMFSSWNAGRFAHKFGHLFSLRLGFAGMGLAMVLAGLVPKIFGYSQGAMFAQCAALLLWTVSMCLTWPTLQALLSHEETPAGMPHTAGMYNIIWAGGAAIAYLTGGALLEKFGGETLFWLPAGLHLIELILLTRLPKTASIAATPQPDVESFAETVPPPHVPHPRAKTFLYLAWLANPFAYIAINGILPVIPKLSANLGLSHASAGFVCSVWFWVRLGAFIWFWLWPGWHYRFRWLLAAFLALGISFATILLSSQIWTLIAAQVAFGLAVGLIYYSSLFYSMDVGESKGRRGGIHEAAIGVGVFSGPTVGVTALYLLPNQANAGIWAISSLLILGLIPFLLIQRRGQRQLPL
ncbi:MAG: Major facilitator superfamily 1 [Pedosphaera sp.]|nr:Major facilitator superfamily 1 [Pedosphaera sp.]